MRVVQVSVRDFRCYEQATTALGDGLTVITGANGAGKTNLLEALYFGATGRSFRTANERELVRFGATAARVVLATSDEDGEHQIAVGFAPGQPKRMRVDGADVERLVDAPQRPLVSVFSPDRLELIKGGPSLRRAHLDQFVAAMWPARVATRRAYAQALAQRNALIARIRSRVASPDSLHGWDRQLAAHGVQLMTDRRTATELVTERFHAWCADLGLTGAPGGGPSLAYRPRSRASDAAELAAELAERIDGDVERGFTGHGPHRDELTITREGRELRAYGSQGQQRLALLSLLLAERDALAAHRQAPPLMLLDDVMSELDRDRREALVGLLRGRPGQAVVTATDTDQVPGSNGAGVAHLAVADGRVLERSAA
ncbi:MAG: DNA replication/repair protein RecF [Solirubrobacteraceae bacterium]